MWKYEIIFMDTNKVIDFLNENNLKPENVKIIERGNYYYIFYYVNK